PLREQRRRPLEQPTRRPIVPVRLGEPRRVGQPARFLVRRPGQGSRPPSLQLEKGSTSPRSTATFPSAASNASEYSRTDASSSGVSGLSIASSTSEYPIPARFFVFPNPIFVTAP